MATYRDFLRQKGPLRRCYWVCGPEVVLREAVLDDIRERADVEPLEYAVVEATGKNDAEVWDLLDQYPLRADLRRLLVVRGAERLGHLERLAEWIDDSDIRAGGKMGSPGTTVVFMSTEDEWPLARNAHVREKVISAGSKRSMYVRCALPKGEMRVERAAQIIMQWGDITASEAARMFKRVGYDLGAARSVMHKASYFPEVKPKGKFLDALAPPSAQEDVVDALLGLDKRRAIMSAQELSPQEIGWVIGKLAASLDVLARLEPVAHERVRLSELASRFSLPEQRIRNVIQYAKFYPRKQHVHRVLLLDKVDDAWHRGARTGVMEVLIAAW